MDLKEYLNKPRKEREKYGFYIMPFALSCGEWKEYNNWLKKNYPIQYFLREIVWTEICFQWKNVKHFFRHYYFKFFKPRNVLKFPHLNPIYNDVDTLLEATIERLIIDFVEKEDALNFVDWENSGGEHKKVEKIIRDSYNFFKNVKPQWEKDIDNLLHECYGNKDLEDVQNDNIDEQKDKQLRELEDRLERTKTDYYLKLVRYRRYLWT